MSLYNTYYEITVGSGAAVLLGNDANVIADKSGRVQIQCAGANVRLRTDGTSPTIAIGWQLVMDQNIFPFVLSEAELKACRAIAESGTATLRVMPFTAPY